MSRRRASGTGSELFHPTRRILRFCALSVLVIAGIWVFSVRSDFSPYLEDHALQKRDSAQLPIGVQGKQEHPIDAFVKTFPQLRRPQDLGLADTERAAMIEEGEVEETAELKSMFDWPRTRKLFVFGDSYSTLDKDYRKNGVDGGHHQQFHGKAIDMKWSDYLYAVFHDFHVLQYWNFARPGATVSHSVLKPGLESYGTYETQIEEFRELFTPLPGPSNVDWHGDDALFIVFFGINDMGRLNRDDLHEGGGLDIPSTTQALVTSLMSNTHKLRELGARSFLFLTLPPIQYSPKYNLPSQVGHDIRPRVEQSIETYNAFLREAVADFEREVAEDTNVMLFDLEKYWKLILDYPELFGMTDCERFAMTVDAKRPNLGRMGLCYHDNQHISWSSAALLARAVNGYLLRSSASFQTSNVTETAIAA